MGVLPPKKKIMLRALGLGSRNEPAAQAGTGATWVFLPCAREESLLRSPSACTTQLGMEIVVNVDLLGFEPTTSHGFSHWATEPLSH